MDDCRYQESKQFRPEGISGTALGKPACVNIDKIIEPVMHNNIPLPVIRSKLNGVPPVRIKTSVRESGDLCPQIEPTVKEAKEPED
jgi:hypothetical protein